MNSAPEINQDQVNKKIEKSKEDNFFQESQIFQVTDIDRKFESKIEKPDSLSNEVKQLELFMKPKDNAINSPTMPGLPIVAKNSPTMPGLPIVSLLPKLTEEITLTLAQSGNLSELSIFCHLIRTVNPYMTYMGKIVRETIILLVARICKRRGTFVRS